MLQVNALSYAYPEQVLSFSFSAKTGSITAILGPSGAGKSSLFSLLCGLLKPSSGTVSFSKEDFTDKAAHERPLSILFQEHNLFSHFSVFENIAIGINPALSLQEKDKEAVIVAAKNVGLEGYLSRKPDALSGGQKQRVALARCLVRNKPLLLLDEPFSALDPSLRHDMLQQVKELAAQRNTTILMVTHHPLDAETIADRALLIDKGGVFYHAEKEEIQAPSEIIKPFFQAFPQKT